MAEKTTQQNVVSDLARALTDIMRNNVAAGAAGAAGASNSSTAIPLQVPVPHPTVKQTYTENSKVRFFDLVHIMDQAHQLVAKHCDHEVIGFGFSEQKNTAEGSIVLEVSVQYVAPFGNGKYTMSQLTEYIPHYTGEVRLGSLPVHPFFGTDEDKDAFAVRGQKFSQITQKPTYLHADGYMYVPTMHGMQRLPINSRVVVDPEGYKRGNADRWYNEKVMDGIKDELIYNTLSTVPVYSLEYRRWGEVPVDSLREIDYDETAYDRIVLNDAYKTLIKNLVVNFYNVETTDFIVGKKSGLYFLLNGPPGTGKTLTANAIAELCHRPIYSIGSGDLGTNAAHIENKLKTIFDMVSLWNGIVLIDEADVFMAERTDYNLDYNSCVSVFLRLVEAYYGILILTTNRSNNIDSAFDSRIDVRLNYENLDLAGRGKVWYESLKRYKNAGINIDELALHKLNNREISRIVKLANIAEADPSRVTTRSLIDFINLRSSFKLSEDK